MLDVTDPRTLDLWIDLGLDGETIAEFAERVRSVPQVSIDRTRRETAAAYIIENTALLEEVTLRGYPGMVIRL